MSAIVLGAGGTGGHLFPAQALAAELTRRGWHIVVMTDRRGKAFADSFPQAEIARVPAASFADRSLLGRVAAMARICLGIVVAFLKLLRIRPKAVVGFGGYASLPVMLAASLARLPTAIHEQNAVLGRVNRLVAGRVRAVAASFPIVRFTPRDPSRVTLVGNPIRPAAARLSGAPFEAPQPGGSIRLLVFGGSQGARRLGEIVPAAVAILPEQLRTRLEIVQQARPEDTNTVRGAYSRLGVAAEVRSFFDDLPARMAAAHLVVARSGASTVAELAAIGRPAILVPYPHATDDHQAANAAVLERAGAAWMVRESDLSPESLAALLVSALEDMQGLAARAIASRGAGRPDAAARLADLVEKLARGDAS